LDSTCERQQGDSQGQPESEQRPPAGGGQGERAGFPALSNITANASYGDGTSVGQLFPAPGFGSKQLILPSGEALTAGLIGDTAAM
jgi:hypothetical protein